MARRLHKSRKHYPFGRMREDFPKTSGILTEDFQCSLPIVLWKSSQFLLKNLSDLLCFQCNMLICFINLLWLRFSKNRKHFRIDRLCFLDHHFGQMWVNKYGEFKSSEPGSNGLWRRLPAGSYNLYACLAPKYVRTTMMLFSDFVVCTRILMLLSAFITLKYVKRVENMIDLFVTYPRTKLALYNWFGRINFFFSNVWD